MQSADEFPTGELKHGAFMSLDDRSRHRHRYPTPISPMASCARESCRSLFRHWANSTSCMSSCFQRHRKSRSIIAIAASNAGKAGDVRHHHRSSRRNRGFLRQHASIDLFGTAKTPNFTRLAIEAQTSTWLQAASGSYSGRCKIAWSRRRRTPTLPPPKRGSASASCSRRPSGRA
jgi:hypothetical protein